MSLSPISPGFIALHSHRSERLADTLTGWLRAHPLDPLESEVVLVQSNGMAEWIKIELARQGGVCAATRVELPSRFLWRTYRQVLGTQNVPPDSPLDKLPMTWRHVPKKEAVTLFGSGAPIEPGIPFFAAILSA